MDPFVIGALIMTSGSILQGLTQQEQKVPTSAKDKNLEAVSKRFREVRARRELRSQLASFVTGKPIETDWNKAKEEEEALFATYGFNFMNDYAGNKTEDKYKTSFDLKSGERVELKKLEKPDVSSSESRNKIENMKTSGELGTTSFPNKDKEPIPEGATQPKAYSLDEMKDIKSLFGKEEKK